MSAHLPASTQPDVPPTTAPRPPLRPGQLTLAWRAVLAIGWVGIIVCLMIVAGTGEVSGRPVWWLGAPGDRAPLPLVLLPFVLPVAVVALAAQGTRWVAELSVVASLATGAVAVFDAADAPGSAVITGALAGAGMLLSIAAFAGRARAARPAPRADPGPGRSDSSELIA